MSTSHRSPLRSTSGARGAPLQRQFRLTPMRAGAHAVAPKLWRRVTWVGRPTHVGAPVSTVLSKRPSRLLPQGTPTIVISENDRFSEYLQELRFRRVLDSVGDEEHRCFRFRVRAALVLPDSGCILDVSPLQTRNISSPQRMASRSGKAQIAPPVVNVPGISRRSCRRRLGSRRRSW